MNSLQVSDTSIEPEKVRFRNQKNHENSAGVNASLGKFSFNNHVQIFYIF